MRGALVALLLALAATVIGCGGSDEPSPVPPPTRPSLQTGLTEGNPFLLLPPGVDVPAAFAPWRDRLDALHARYVRVLVDWEKIQPSADRPPDFAVPSDGCMRGVPPCAPHLGVASVLQAIASRRARGDDAEPIVVIYGTPAWAARTPRAQAPGDGACGLSSRAREPDAAAYGALVSALRAQAGRDNLTIRWWAPWNEPNHPAFLAPQRAACDAASPSTAAARYARIVDAFLAARAPGERILLGETAGYDEPRPSASSVREFIDALPRRTVCASSVWAQHVYVAQPGGEGASQDGAPLAGDADAAGSPALLREVLAALDRRGCPLRHRLWLTETGAGGPKPGRDRPTDERSLRAACLAMADALERWRDDPRVDVAVQYSFREDPSFPVGLADPGLTRLYAPYGAWKAVAEGKPARSGCPSPSG